MPLRSSTFAPLQQRLYLVTLRVARGTNRELPAHMPQAVVPVFVPAQDYELAAQAAIDSAEQDGFVAHELLGEIRVLDIQTWDDYVRREWPEDRHFLPSSVMLRRLISSNQPFFGPISGWQPPAQRARKATPAVELIHHPA